MHRLTAFGLKLINNLLKQIRSPLILVELNLHFAEPVVELEILVIGRLEYFAVDDAAKRAAGAVEKLLVLVGYLLDNFVGIVWVEHQVIVTLQRHRTMRTPKLNRLVFLLQVNCGCKVACL